MTARQAAEIAEGCRAYLAAHEKRPPGDQLGTLAEHLAANILWRILDRPRRKPCPPRKVDAA